MDDLGYYPWGYTTWYPDYGMYNYRFRGRVGRLQPSSRTGYASSSRRSYNPTSYSDSGRVAAEAGAFTNSVKGYEFGASNTLKEYQFGPSSNSVKNYQFGPVIQNQTVKALQSTATILDNISKKMIVNPIAGPKFRKPANVVMKRKRTYGGPYKRSGYAIRRWLPRRRFVPRKRYYRRYY
jgi:hypothetical protein